MTLLLNLFSMIPIALQRIWRQRLLMACLLLGLVAAVALSASIPLYADAVQRNLLQTQLADEENPGPPPRVTKRRPFAAIGITDYLSRTIREENPRTRPTPHGFSPRAPEGLSPDVPCDQGQGWWRRCFACGV